MIGMWKNKSAGPSFTWRCGGIRVNSRFFCIYLVTTTYLVSYHHFHLTTDRLIKVTAERQSNMFSLCLAHSQEDYEVKINLTGRRTQQ